MASFKEICFTPAEFAGIAKVDRSTIPGLESARTPEDGEEEESGTWDRKDGHAGGHAELFPAPCGAGRHGDQRGMDSEDATGMSADRGGDFSPVAAATESGRPECSWPGVGRGGTGECRAPWARARPRPERRLP